MRGNLWGGGAVAFVYRYYDAIGQLLYVGITSENPLNRDRQHRHAAPWYSEVARYSWQAYPGRTDALRAEAEAIATEAPLYNVAGGYLR